MERPPQSLFDHSWESKPQGSTPLAARMRPSTLAEVVGQEHVVGDGTVLRRALAADKPPSMILWGPPGCGKTTLARLIAGETQCYFEPVSAVTAGVADLRRVVGEARDRLRQTGLRTILFIDEIHRFNKSQQDAVLPHVEDGTVVLIGATTENPSFEVIGPLLSRSRVYALKPLTAEQMAGIVQRALADTDRGLGGLNATIDDDALAYLVEYSGGDARSALNTLDLAVAATLPEAGVRRVTLATLEDAVQHRAYTYDRAGESHYDTISAFIKSIRGSDPDAALYWLARMIEAGEDPLFIVRRLVISAGEDVGLADPQALSVAVACQQAVHFIGMPEGFIPMAECTVYLATAPKSNASYAAYHRAVEDVRKHGSLPVPLHLRNAVTGLMRGMGYGQGYQYAHDHPDHYVEQEFRPPALQGNSYYQPGSLGYEERIQAWMERLRDRSAEPS